MDKVTRYMSYDGCLWLTEAEAVDREKVLTIINSELKRLKPRPSNHFEGYIQQNLNEVNLIKRIAVTLSDSEYPNKIWRSVPAEKVNPSAAMEYLHPYSPVSKLWSRLALIDSEGREWDQMYFIYNPDKAVMEEYKDSK